MTALPAITEAPTESRIWPIKIEITVKHRISQNWPIFRWNSVENEEYLTGKNIPAESLMHATTHTSLHTPKQCEHAEAAAWGASQDKTMELITYPKIQTRAVSERLLCVRWCAVSQLSEENRDNSMLHTLSHAKVSLKGGKTDFLSMKTEKIKQFGKKK